MTDSGTLEISELTDGNKKGNDIKYRTILYFHES